jgi:hypothetical protein
MSSNFDIPNSLPSTSIAGHASNFPQTGSWSMVDLLSKPINVTVGILQRYSAGRVDPYTAVVGQAMCSKFQLAAVGRKRLDDALSSLSAVSSLGDVLYFGFGAEDIVRSLSKTEEGAICLAMCAALRDCYHEDVAVEVLLELARLTDVPGKYMPSSFEWKALLNACSGALATTTFALQAEQLMSLSQAPERLGAFNALEASPSALRSCSSPKSVAEVLFAIARVTKGELKAITIVGGADAGWLAALSQWLCDCKVKVTRGDGSVVYQNVQDDEQVQLNFIFRAQEKNVNPTSEELKLYNKTFILDDVSQIFRDEGRWLDGHVVSGRVAWDEALSKAFMGDFRKLMEMPFAVGLVIGSAARIFEAIAASDDRIPLKYRAACSSYCTNSFGGGFIMNTIFWFPELAKLQKYMEKAAKTTLEAAQGSYEVGIQNLKTACQCASCTSSYSGFQVDTGEEDTAMSDGEEESEHGIDSEDEDIQDWDPDKFCLVILAETIICLSRSLAHMEVAKELYPMRSGLEVAYGRQLTLRRSSNLGRSSIKEIGQIVFCLDFDNSFSWKAEEDMAEIRLFHALELFTGRTPPRRTWGVSAQCVNGICAFLTILKEHSDQKEAVGRIHVLPGRIEVESKSYTILEDQRLSDPELIDFTTVLKHRNQIENDLKLQLRVKERSNSLQCLLEFPVGGTHSPVLVGPAKLASMLASTRGRVTCKAKGKCKKVVNTAETLNLVNGVSEVPHGGIYLSTFKSTSSIHTLLVLATASSLSENCSVYLVDQECYDCCVTAAVGIDRPEERNRFCFLRQGSLS